MSSRVELLRSLRDSPVSEEDALNLFDNGAPAPGAFWGPEDLRSFLADLCIAFHRDLVVPDSCVEAALKELQLDANEQGRISKMEWKSFFLYLLDAPLIHLETMAFRSLPPSAIFRPQQTVMLTFTSADIQSLSKIKAQAEVQDAVGASLSEFLWAHSGTAAGALVVLPNEAAFNKAVNLTELPSGVAVEAKQFEGAIAFPSWVAASSHEGASKPSFVAKALASTLLFGAMVGSRAKTIDEQMGISRTAQAAYDSTSKAVTDTDEKFGITRGVKDAATSVDKKLHISETAASASKKGVEAVDQVKRSSTAQTTMSYVGGLFTRVKSAASKLKDETVVAMADQKQNERS